MSETLASKNLLMIMYGLYYSIVTYGIMVWGSAKNNVLNTITNVHKKIVKILLKADPNVKLPLNIQQKFILETVLYYYEPLSLTFVNSTSSTRHKSIQLPKFSKDVGKRSHLFNAAKFFNELPNDLKNRDKKIIKNKLKQFLSTKYTNVL